MVRSSRRAPSGLKTGSQAASHPRAHTRSSTATVYTPCRWTAAARCRPSGENTGCRTMSKVLCQSRPSAPRLHRPRSLTAAATRAPSGLKTRSVTISPTVTGQGTPSTATVQRPKLGATIAARRWPFGENARCQSWTNRRFQISRPSSASVHFPSMRTGAATVPLRGMEHRFPDAVERLPPGGSVDGNGVVVEAEAGFGRQRRAVRAEGGLPDVDEALAPWCPVGGHGVEALLVFLEVRLAQGSHLDHGGGVPPVRAQRGVGQIGVGGLPGQVVAGHPVGHVLLESDCDVPAVRAEEGVPRVTETVLPGDSVDGDRPAPARGHQGAQPAVGGVAQVPHFVEALGPEIAVHAGRKLGLAGLHNGRHVFAARCGLKFMHRLEPVGPRGQGDLCDCRSPVISTTACGHEALHVIQWKKQGIRPGTCLPEAVKCL